MGARSLSLLFKETTNPYETNNIFKHILRRTRPNEPAAHQQREQEMTPMPLRLKKKRPTCFLDLPHELRQQILSLTYDNSPILSFYNKHKDEPNYSFAFNVLKHNTKCAREISMLGMKLRNVHNEIILDVNLVQREWEKPLKGREMVELRTQEGGEEKRGHGSEVEIEGWDGVVQGLWR